MRFTKTDAFLMKRYDYYIIDLSLSYSVEDTENRSLNVLNAHTHRNYVVLAGTDQLTGRHSRHTPLNHLLLFLLHLHRQLIGTIAHRQPHPVPVALLIKHVLSYFFQTPPSGTLPVSLELPSLGMCILERVDMSLVLVCCFLALESV
jgi:hypothetical protein